MTVASADKTYCEPEKHLVWYENKSPAAYHSSIFSTDISRGASSSSASANYRICLTQGGYCNRDFFGPIFQTVVQQKQHYTNQYFMSPLDRRSFSSIAELELEETESEENQQLSQMHTYIVGLFDQSEVSQYSSHQGSLGVGKP